MTNFEPIVYVVDDDDCIRDVVTQLLTIEGLLTKSFASAEEFLDHCNDRMRGCLILDVSMPRMSGLELQQLLLERNITIPIIFLSGHGDIPMTSQAFRSGAVDFLEKPFDDIELLDRIKEALYRDAEHWHQRLRRAQLTERISNLSKREKEVMKFICTGYTSKETAKALSISNRTVDIYRAHVMLKMEANTLAELISMGLELENYANH